MSGLDEVMQGRLDDDGHRGLVDITGDGIHYPTSYDAGNQGEGRTWGNIIVCIFGYRMRNLAPPPCIVHGAEGGEELDYRLQAS